MIVQRLFSHTWENLKTPEKRHKKAEELKQARNKINKRVENLKKIREEDLRKAAFGELRNNDGKKLNSEAVEGRFKSDMKDINTYRDSIRDTKHRTPKPKPTPKPEPISGLEKAGKYIKSKGKEILKKPETKKIGYIGAGALAGTLAVSGVDKAVKKHKEKKKEDEARKQVLGKK